MSADAIILPDFLDKVTWHHTVQLADGQLIGWGKSIEVMAQQFEMTFGPLDLAGKSVLDIGTWSGAFAVEAARRGADRVVGLDHVVWHPPFQYGRDAFDFIVAASGFQIDGVDLDLDMSPLALKELGTFDVVLFLGVFYHLKDPIGVLKEISKLTRECLVIETYWEAALPQQPPAMVFYPNRELANDPTNWWGPNVACVEALLHTFDFPRVVVADGSYENRKVFHAYKTS
jgi:tRNA (mo5U34)-methyltransferase